MKRAANRRPRLTPAQRGLTEYVVVCELTHGQLRAETCIARDPDEALRQVEATLDHLPVEVTRARVMDARELLDGIEREHEAPPAPLVSTSGVGIDDRPAPAEWIVEQFVDRAWQRVLGPVPADEADDYVAHARSHLGGSYRMTIVD